MSVCADVAADPVHEEMSVVERRSGRNIYLISVTCAVFQLSNVLVERRSGIKHIIISVTCAVFQLPMSWLNAEAH